jgi:HEAT repeat protein
MGNASTRRESDVKVGRSVDTAGATKKLGTISVVRTFFFFACLLATAVAAFSQDLSTYAETLHKGNVEEKREALFQIRNLRSAEASRIAVAALNDDTPIVRATAASSVTFLPQAEASSDLLPLLNDKDEFVRREAAYALGEVGDVTSGPPLVKALSDDKSPEVKTAAAIALGKVGNPVAVPVLVQLLGHRPTEDTEMLRSAAAGSIGHIAEKMRSGKLQTVTPQNFLPDKYKDLGTKPTPDLLSHFTNAVTTLIRVLENPAEAEDTRRQAAFSLGAIGNTSAEPVLSKHITSSDPYLAEICKEAVRKLRSAE